MICYGCDCCAEEAEGWATVDRSYVRVMPDGSWLCNICYDDGPLDGYGVAPLTTDFKEWPEWESFPPPPEYGSVESVETKCEWQPMETAPTDGTRFLAYDPRFQPHFFECWANLDCGEYYWMDDMDSEPEPTHWRPLPEPPEGVK